LAGEGVFEGQQEVVAGKLDTLQTFLAVVDWFGDGAHFFLTLISINKINGGMGFEFLERVKNLLKTLKTEKKRGRKMIFA